MSGLFNGGQGKPLRLLNIALGLVVVLIGGAMAKSWVSSVAPPLSVTVPKPLPETGTLAWSASARPPLAQFDVLLEKNPFKQPPPMPVMPLQSAAPLPLPTLVGTILVDSDRRAILSDKGKANIYSVGQAVAGGIITEIREDRIIFKRGDTTHELKLKAAIQAPAAALPQGSEPAPSQVSAVASPTAPSPPPIVPPHAASAPSSPPVGLSAPNLEEEIRRRQEEMLQRAQEMRERLKGLQQGR